jgi:hypothetical protein
MSVATGKKEGDVAFMVYTPAGRDWRIIPVVACVKHNGFDYLVWRDENGQEYGGNPVYDNLQGALESFKNVISAIQDQIDELEKKKNRVADKIKGLNHFALSPQICGPCVHRPTMSYSNSVCNQCMLKNKMKMKIPEMSCSRIGVLGDD